MKRISLAFALLALGLAAATPARADFALIQFPGGRCEIWWDSGDTPWGAGWRKLAIMLPSWDAARLALDTARVDNECR